MSTNRRFPDKRLGELILYLSDLCKGDDAFGATKLNKLLFYADFVAYRQLGKPITGQPYQHLGWGPAPRRLIPVKDQLIAEGALAERMVNTYDHVQKRPVPLRDPDISMFSAEEVDLVHQMVKLFEKKNATQISEESHLFVGWDLTENGDAIPYETALLNNHLVITEDIRTHAESLKPDAPN